MKISNKNIILKIKFKVVYIFLLLSSTLLLSGCYTSSSIWDNTSIGEIKGEIFLKWRSNKEKPFIYIPDAANPFTYITSDGDVIRPESFYTDGGSIPKFLQIDSNFDSWKFGPAYIIHDWLFEIHHCGLNEEMKYDHEKAADIMTEVIKTQLVNEGKVGYRMRYLMKDIYAYSKAFSKSLWESDNATCDIPPQMEIETHMDTNKPPIMKHYGQPVEVE